MSDKRKVLFVCTGNAGRSQMAEALSRTHYSDVIEPQSAGVDPWPHLHPMAKKLMAERGDLLSGHYPKHVNTFREARLDVIVTIGDRAQNELPRFVHEPERIHWDISDPADADGTAESEATFRRALDDIESELAAFIRERSTDG